jgi:hypothetical protein
MIRYLKIIFVCRKEIQLKIKPIRRRLKEKKNDEQLIDLATTGIHAFSINRSPRIVTYRRLIYIKDIISALERRCTTNHFSDRDMVELFIYKNFNCARFVSFCINEIANKISLLPEDANKIDRLAFCLKQINQMQVKPGFAFKQHSESVKEQLATWMNEEMLFLEQKQRSLPIVPVLKNEVLTSDEDKLHLSVSVDVMTLLARAAKDSKLILNKQMAGMFRNIARFCRTKNSENPSPGSMLNKSYVAERHNKEAAIDILHEMIKQLNRYCIIPMMLSTSMNEILDVLFGG